MGRSQVQYNRSRGRGRGRGEQQGRKKDLDRNTVKNEKGKRINKSIEHGNETIDLHFEPGSNKSFSSSSDKFAEQVNNDKNKEKHVIHNSHDVCLPLSCGSSTNFLDMRSERNFGIVSEENEMVAIDAHEFGNILCLLPLDQRLKLSGSFDNKRLSEFLCFDSKISTETDKVAYPKVAELDCCQASLSPPIHSANNSITSDDEMESPEIDEDDQDDIDKWLDSVIS